MKEKLCPDCIRNESNENPYLDKLIHYMELQMNGCPIERHELSNFDWKMLGTIKREYEIIQLERAKAKAGIKTSS